MLADLRHTDFLARKHRTEVDLALLVADASTGGDDRRLVAGENLSVDIYGDHSESFIRLAGPAGSLGWRYDSAGKLSRPAQGPDGTIYTIERYPIGVNNPNGTPIVETQILLLDGSNGAVRARYPLARLTGHADAGCSAILNVDLSPKTLGPIVGSDGFGYVLVQHLALVHTGPICNTSSQDVGFSLLRVSPTGAVTSTAVHSQHCTSGSPSSCDKAPDLKEIFPDGIGGTLVRAFVYTGVTENGYSGEMRLMRVANDAVQFSNVVDFDERITMIGDAGTAFVHGDDVRAVDVTNWTPVCCRIFKCSGTTMT